MTPLSFTVPGEPVPQGSKRIGKNRRTGRPIVLDDNDKPLKAWRQKVANAAAFAMLRAELTTFDEPLRVQLAFYLARPAGHYGTGKNRNRVKPSAPARPAVKPDVDKLTRAVFDALTDAAVWFDDSRVVSVTAVKLYDADAGCRVSVSTLDAGKADA